MSEPEKLANRLLTPERIRAVEELQALYNKIGRRLAEQLPWEEDKPLLAKPTPKKPKRTRFTR